jgi:hypothetical protein
MTVRIPVRASEGMFRDELSVSITLMDGRTVSLFADKSLIFIDDSGNHLLETALISEDRASRKQVVLLPTETFETSSRYVEVPL